MYYFSISFFSVVQSILLEDKFNYLAQASKSFYECVPGCCLQYHLKDIGQCRPAPRRKIRTVKKSEMCLETASLWILLTLQAPQFISITNPAYISQIVRADLTVLVLVFKVVNWDVGEKKVFHTLQRGSLYRCISPSVFLII